jgi:hypothetical protein
MNELLALLLLTHVRALDLPNFGPSPGARILQARIDQTIRQSDSIVSISPGDYYFGNTSLVIHGASNFTLCATAGPGTVQFWFSIGSGVLVNQSSDVILDGLSVDYDPPAHYQGTIVQVIDDSSSDVIQALVKTDAGFLNPAVFDAAYRLGRPGVQSGPAALVWNSSDEFGAFTSASWPPTTGANGTHVFSLQRKSFCKDISSTITDGTSCLGNSTSKSKLQPQDKITAHIRAGFTLHILNSTRVHTQHTAIHGASGFAITEYDGYGAHSYFNVSLGRRHHNHNHNHTAESMRNSHNTTNNMCGVSNPTGGRLCLGLISSNNDALHSSGCKYGPSFTHGELSYCLGRSVSQSVSQVLVDEWEECRPVERKGMERRRKERRGVEWSGVEWSGVEGGEWSWSEFEACSTCFQSQLLTLCMLCPFLLSSSLADDWVNIHSRVQVVLERVDARNLLLVDPRLDYAVSVADEFPYGNVETLVCVCVCVCKMCKMCKMCVTCVCVCECECVCV